MRIADIRNSHCGYPQQVRIVDIHNSHYGYPQFEWRTSIIRIVDISNSHCGYQQLHYGDLQFELCISAIWIKF
jgi:hypothetical protein